MPIPTVTAGHFDQALAKCVDKTPGGKNARGHAYREICRTMSAELPELAAMLVDGIGQSADGDVAASSALSLSAMLYEAYRIAGARFTPVAPKEMAGCLEAEDEWLRHLHKLPANLAQESEEQYFLQRPNGEVLKLAMDTLRVLAAQHKPADLLAWTLALERARNSVGAAHTALNLSCGRK